MDVFEYYANRPCLGARVRRRHKVTGEVDSGPYHWLSFSEVSER